MADRDTLIHLVAGGVGGTAGAIITCPLEVVKTRLQGSNSGFGTQLKPPTAGSAENPRRPAAEPQAKTSQWTGKVYRRALGSQYTVNVQLLRANSAQHFGSVTPILYSTASQPCRPLQSKLSMHHDRTSAKVHTGHSVIAQPRVHTNMGVWACLRHIVQHEGPRGLFRGLVPNLVGVAPSRAIYFWSYSTSKKTINRNLPWENRDTPFVHILSAASAGFVSSCATNPIWLIKTRLQLDRSQSSLPSVVRRIHAEGGLKGFWKGLTASWWGISETMIHFVIYEYLKKCLARRQESDRGRHKSNELSVLNFLGIMMCGATSKTCATCVAYPHEVARTRMRESGLKYRSFWQTLRLVHREEGRRGLYRGLSTQLVRQIPNTAIMMATYELTVYLLKRQFC